MTDRERDLLTAARSGDEDAYAGLAAPYRAALHAHCYRMLGSLPDAEDALQESLLRAWRGLPRFEGRSSLRSGLYTIATNACLKAIERRPRRVLPLDYGGSGDPDDAPGRPLIESVWIAPYPDREIGLEDGLAAPDARYEQRESVELAFIAALQQLPLRQRAVLILRDVLGLSGAETAAALGTTPASVCSALQRAHRTLDQRRLDRSQQSTLRALAFAHYRWDGERGGFRAHGISVLTRAGDRIAEIMAFLDASTFPGFGLPAELRIGPRTAAASGTLAGPD
ncbi:MAG TPA: RNA polymerase subunit sigma-70 [Gaiellales bacterium]|nr:RNA polymerase subunit sigma-70 [Gaiellales bacterium]